MMEMLFYPILSTNRAYKDYIDRNIKIFTEIIKRRIENAHIDPRCKSYMDGHYKH